MAMLLNVVFIKELLQSLSIICKLIKAKLIVYDSFEGLPFSEKNLGLRNYPHL
jgi:hypothetical protein